MKSLLLLAFGLFSGLASAEVIGPAGCGLGHMAFGGKDSQVLAATTNGTSYSQLFGITSGTSNCVDSSGTAKLDAFIEGNKQAFSTEAARGEGETLNSVAEILKCVNPSRMNQAIKANHSKIFASGQSEEIGSNIRNVLAEEQVICIHGA